MQKQHYDEDIIMLKQKQHYDEDKNDQKRFSFQLGSESQIYRHNANTYMYT